MGSGNLFRLSLLKPTTMSFPVKLARVIHLVSAVWTLCLAALIFCDVTGRGVFSHPIPGTKEIIQNSVVAITFLQLPLAIYSGSMLRTTVFANAVPATLRRIFRSLGYILGVVFFIALFFGTYESFFDALRIGEYEGEGALRVPTWPVRGLILVMAAFGAWAYLSMLIYDWRNQLVDENEAPESLS